MNKKKVLVGLSGGVDSSVAAFILKQQGFHVTGVTMKIYSGTDRPEKAIDTCYSPFEEQDIEDAKALCSHLDIPYHVVDLRKAYKEKILTYFKREYVSGRTPNPCVRCNKEMKFGLLMEKAFESGVAFDFFATGHYARIGFDELHQRFYLKNAIDSNKDQTYFLSLLSQEQLKKAIFPLGNLFKSEVRKIAENAGLPTHNRKESKSFISGSYTSVIDEKEQKGFIKNADGEILGEHKGIWNYTIGQRKGLGITGKSKLYVTKIDECSNTVFVSKEPELYKTYFHVSKVSWMAIDAIKTPLRATIKVRSVHSGASAIISPLSEDSVIVNLDEPERAITPGQQAVFYNDGKVLGSGVIEND